MRVYDVDYPVIAQDHDWDCSQHSLQWALWASGRQSTDEWLEQAMVDQGVASRQQGLLEGSGAGLVEFVKREYRDLGFSANNESCVTFDAVAAEAGEYPLLIGGHHWGDSGHWSAVRRYDPDRDLLMLANPANGHAGVGQSMTRAQFQRLGPFSLVRILIAQSTGDDDMYKEKWEGLLNVIAHVGDVIADDLELERAQLDDYGDAPAPPDEGAPLEAVKQYADAMRAWADTVRANTDARYEAIGAIGLQLRKIRIELVGPRPSPDGAAP